MNRTRFHYRVYLLDYRTGVLVHGFKSVLFVVGRSRSRIFLESAAEVGKLVKPDLEAYIGYRELGSVAPHSHPYPVVGQVLAEGPAGHFLEPPAKFVRDIIVRAQRSSSHRGWS